jgi:hypothetical protein
MNEEHLKDNLLMWFTINRKGEEEKTPCFWRLFQIRTLGSQVNAKSPTLALNFEVEEAEESVELLLENLKTFVHVRFLSIKFMRAKNDNNYLVHSFQNPYYNPDSENSMISGTSTFGGGQMGAIGAYLELSQSKSDDRFLFMQMQHKSEIESFKRDIEKQQEIKDLKAEIEAVKAANSSILKEIILELKEPAKELLGMFVQSKIKPNEIVHTEIVESKYKDFEVYLDMITAKYGRENFKQMVGEMAVILNESEQDFHIVRNQTNSTAKKLIDSKKNG